MAKDFESFIESLNYNQFSGSMIFVLFFQIFFVVLPERYFYLLNPIEWTQKIYTAKKNEVAEKLKTSFLKNKKAPAALSGVEKLKKANDKLKSIGINKILVNRKKGFQVGLQRVAEAFKNNSQGLKNLVRKKSRHPLEVEIIKKNEKINISKDYRYNPLLKKYYFHLALIFITTIYIFLWLPLQSHKKLNGTYFCNARYVSNGTSKECNNFTDNGYVIFFYIIYFAYFFFSALQMKKGESIFKGRRSHMESYTFVHKFIFQVYKAVPFLFEIKTSFDYFVTPTGMDLWQWFKFEDIYGNLFMSKCVLVSKSSHALGDKMGKIEKLFGLGMFIVLLGVILLPMYIFSNFNPASEPNIVTVGHIELGISSSDNYYPLYKEDHFDTNIILNDVKNTTEEKLIFSKFDQIQNISDLLRTIDLRGLQLLSVYPNSYNFWDITMPSYYELVNSLNESLNKQKEVNLVLKYYFDQKTGSSSNNMTQLIEDQDLLTELLYVTTNCIPNRSVIFPNFYNNVKNYLFIF